MQCMLCNYSVDTTFTYLAWPNWGLLGLTGPYWVILGLTGPYWALLVLTWPYWSLTGPYYALT